MASTVKTQFAVSRTSTEKITANFKTRYGFSQEPVWQASARIHDTTLPTTLRSDGNTAPAIWQPASMSLGFGSQYLAPVDQSWVPLSLSSASTQLQYFASSAPMQLTAPISLHPTNTLPQHNYFAIGSPPPTPKLLGRRSHLRGTGIYSRASITNRGKRATYNVSKGLDECQLPAYADAGNVIDRVTGQERKRRKIDDVVRSKGRLSHIEEAKIKAIYREEIDEREEACESGWEGKEKPRHPPTPPPGHIVDGITGMVRKRALFDDFLDREPLKKKEWLERRFDIMREMPREKRKGDWEMGDSDLDFSEWEVAKTSRREKREKWEKWQKRELKMMESDSDISELELDETQLKAKTKRMLHGIGIREVERRNRYDEDSDFKVGSDCDEVKERDG